MSRLDDRVRKLQTHFALTSRDIEQIVTSTEKVTKRGQRIKDVELGAEAIDAAEVSRALPAANESASVGTKSGQLRLRVVDEGA